MWKSLYTRFGIFGLLLWGVGWGIWEIIKNAVFGWATNLLAERWALIETTVQQAYPAFTAYGPPVILLIVAFGIVWAAYRLGRKEDPQKITSAGRAREGAADTTNKRQMVPLLDALRWIIDNSGWELGHGPDSNLDLAAIEVRQAARDSEVTIRGRREMDRHMPGEAFDQTWENIEPDYWRTHEIDVGGIMTGGYAHQETQVIYQSLGDIVSESMPHYAMLRIYKHEMEARWPAVNTLTLKKLAK